MWSVVAVLSLAVVVLGALGVVSCLVSHQRPVPGGMGGEPPNSTLPMLALHSGMERLRLEAGVGAGRPERQSPHAHARRAADCAAAMDRAARLAGVSADLQLNLPHSIALPDGEELPYGASARLHIRDPMQESEIYQKCIRPPPNRTVFDGESPPPYRPSPAVSHGHGAPRHPHGHGHYHHHHHLHHHPPPPATSPHPAGLNPQAAVIVIPPPARKADPTAPSPTPSPSLFLAGPSPTNTGKHSTIPCGPAPVPVPVHAHTAPSPAPTSTPSSAAAVAAAGLARLLSPSPSPAGERGLADPDCGRGVAVPGHGHGHGLGHGHGHSRTANSASVELVNVTSTACHPAVRDIPGAAPGACARSGGGSGSSHLAALTMVPCLTESRTALSATEAETSRTEHPSADSAASAGAESQGPGRTVTAVRTTARPLPRPPV